jgi:hypothetical protein
MKAGAVGKKCTEADLAYIAGLIDGDGAVMAIIEPHSEKKFRFRVRISIKITQKERKHLLFLPQLLGTGSVQQNRTAFDWVSRDQKEIARVLGDLLPFSRIKHMQMKKALKILDTSIRSREDLMRVARLADTLARCNVRSNNRRKNHVTKIEAHFSSND